MHDHQFKIRAVAHTAASAILPGCCTFRKKSVTTFFFLFFGEFETRCDTCVSSSRMISAGFPPLQNQLLPPHTHMHAYAQRVHSIFYCNKFIDISKKMAYSP